MRPCRECGDFCCAERRIIRKFPDRRIGKPRRHRSSFHRLANRCAERPRLFVGFERHGRDRALAVATLAVPLQDGKNVAIESGRRSPGRILFVRTIGQMRQSCERRNGAQHHGWLQRKRHDRSLDRGASFVQPRRHQSTISATQRQVSVRGTGNKHPPGTPKS